MKLLRIPPFVFLSIYVAETHSWTLPVSGNPPRTAVKSTAALATDTLARRTTTILADDDAFVKPDRDTRSYRIIQLPNQLKCLLVSDGGVATGVEAAAVHVQSGHFDDTIPGLAHFHEHMLFLGTKKYPREDDYETFLSQYGGASNAYTDMEDTNYYFSVTTEHEDDNQTTVAMQGALDRLAHFFIDPLFDKDATDRECKAIDNEYKMSLTSDQWKNYQLLKSVANPLHPFHKFGCGNYDTLYAQGLDTLLQELNTFWETYYQTYNLRLAVLGHASLDALQQTVEATFGQLPDSQGTPRRQKARPGQFFEREHAVYNAPAFDQPQLGVVRLVQPLQETRSLKVYFATPPLDDPVLQSTKPYRVLSHLLGHEAPGSLHAYLSEQGYLTGLSSGVSLDTSDFSLVSLSLALTPKGMKERDKVLDLVFQWIALVKQQTHEKLEAYHNELRSISRMNFRFRENGDPTDFCSSAAELLFDDLKDPGHFLMESADSENYNATVVDAFFDRFRVENCMITVIDSDLDSEEGDWEVEPWYKAKYQTHPFTPEQRERWGNPKEINEHLSIPALNAYIPSDFSLRCDDVPSEDEITKDEVLIPPKLLIDKANLRLWHKMDRYWRVPKAFIRVSLMTPNVYRSPRTMTYNRIFQRVLNDDLNSYVYDASVAGCNYRVSCTPDGWRISVRGYSEKLLFLLDTLTSRILSLIEEMKDGDEVLQAKFDKAKESLLRETKNYRLDTPHEINSYNSRLLVEENGWYLDNYIDEMEGEAAEKEPLTMGDCARTLEECLRTRVKGEALCMGNIDENGAKQVADVIDSHFLGVGRPLHEVELPRFRSLKIPTKEEACRIFGPAIMNQSVPFVYQELAYSESEDNNAVEMIYQTPCEFELGYQGLAALDLIGHMAYNSAFGQLRTKEQLGYIVSAFPRKTAGGAWALSVVVQSGSASPQVLEERIQAWMLKYREELEKMDPEDIEQEASAVIAQLLEEDTKLGQEVGRVWGEILNTESLSTRMKTPAFDRIDRLAFELSVDEEEGRYGTAQELKDYLLEFFDTYFLSSERRLLSARLFGRKFEADYEASRNEPGVLSSFEDMRHVKQFLSSWPLVPYWAADGLTASTSDDATDV